MGSYNEFFILNNFACVVFVFIIVLYALKIDVRLPVFIFCIFCIYVQTISHPGGPDYIVYERFYNDVIHQDWNTTFRFLSSELLLLPFFLLGFTFDIGFRWSIFSCFLLLYIFLYFRLFLSKKNYSYFFSLTFATLLVSPMAPYLFGNVIRQGLASLVVIYFMIFHLSGTAGNGLRFTPVFLLTHRSSLIFSLFQFFLNSRWQTKLSIIFGLSFLTYIASSYFTENINSFIEFYRSFDFTADIGQTSIQRTILRFVFIISPLIIWICLEKNSLQRDWRILAYFIVLMIAFLSIALKIGDRVMYFTPAIIYPIICSSSSRVVLAISVILIVLQTIALTVIGTYENIFS